MAEEPMIAASGLQPQPSTHVSGRDVAASDHADGTHAQTTATALEVIGGEPGSVPGFDVSAMNREVLERVYGTPSSTSRRNDDVTSELVPNPGGLATELSVLGSRLNGDTRQLIRDREREAQLNQGLRQLSRAMIASGKLPR
ncbi:MAG: hypothetical protein CMF26_03030 [Kiloniella sp.]|nr:hypothetical protein [Kiloniella sp.]